MTKIFTDSKKLPETIAVDSIDLTIQKGEIFGLLGPNGAGKTTTVRMLTCLIRPTSGEAWVEGTNILSEPKKVRASCGILTETPGLYVRLNAIEYLNFFGQLYGLSRQELDTRVPNVLDMLGIDAKDREGKRLGAFSRGMQQKMNIARAIRNNSNTPSYCAPIISMRRIDCAIESALSTTAN
ncbi:TPA: ABC transporter ATP-binding protein [Candidatus Poribacteria bacterium]|nr:ABC transporter ATP-binding protein [Candidatus Poribacteria bacterium]